MLCRSVEQEIEIRIHAKQHSLRRFGNHRHQHLLTFGQVFAGRHRYFEIEVRIGETVEDAPPESHVLIHGSPGSGRGSGPSFFLANGLIRRSLSVIFLMSFYKGSKNEGRINKLVCFILPKSIIFFNAPLSDGRSIESAGCLFAARAVSVIPTFP